MPVFLNLTGETRTCHYVYYGYKVVRDEKGKYEQIKCGPFDNLSDLQEECDYVSNSFYKVLDSKNQTLDYEDGPMDGKEIISEEEYLQSHGKTNK